MEQLTDDAKKKRYGQYFSGKNVANTLVGFLPESATIKNAIDPMVGSGDMLVAVSGKITSIQKVCGVDIDSQAIATCRKRIPNAEVVEGSVFVTDEVLNGSGWDLVITNPPYVRYQLFSTNDEYGLPTGDEVRRNLKDIILRASYVSEDERQLFLKVAENYSGLADLAVPSWVLCALITKKQGYLAMVVPETWLNRDYALPIHYLLLKTFEILTVAKDIDSVWFDNASVRTCLVIAKKRNSVLPLKECNGKTYLLEIGKQLLGHNSVVERLKYKDKTGDDAVKCILQENKNIKGEGFAGYSLETKQLFYNLGMHLNEMKWVLEEDKGIIEDTHILPEEISSIIGEGCELLTLEEMGWKAGQGLRTGANEFFYANVLKKDNQSGMVKIRTRTWNDKEIVTSVENIRMAIQNRNEVPGLCVRSSSLRKCILYLTDAVAPGDNVKLSPEAIGLYRVLDSELESYIRCGEEYLIPKKGKRFGELSAVKPNEKRNKRGYLRFWYMLPKLQKRHEPELCISRLCGKAVECLYVHNENQNHIVVDANFITLWNQKKENNMCMFALLNSTWFKCYMELIGARMGGGALKIEASHIKQVLFPKLTTDIMDELSMLGSQLLNDDCDFNKIRRSIDILLFRRYGKGEDEIIDKLTSLLEKKLTERGAI